MAFRRLTTDGDRVVDPLQIVPAEARPAHADRPWLFTNMVTTLDGATAVDGLSGAIGDEDDAAMFRALRASADIILVGSRTTNVEAYRPPRRSAAVDRARAAAGRSDRPIIAIVSASLSIDIELELFADPTYRPIVFTVDDAPPDKRERLNAVADVRTIGTGSVDLAGAMAHLAAAGHQTVLSEGGPSINGQLIAADLIDEWNLTIAPMLASGGAARAAHGDPIPQLRSLQLDRCWLGDHAMFCRWIRPESASDDSGH
jgi:5-amino-6-(5-phosphoribosylamino)uracil reductase